MAFETQHLTSDSFGRSEMVVRTEYRLSAPVTAIRAAAAGDQVQRKISVSGLPRLAIRVEVRQIPCGVGQCVELGDWRGRADHSGGCLATSFTAYEEPRH